MKIVLFSIQEKEQIETSSFFYMQKVNFCFEKPVLYRVNQKKLTPKKLHKCKQTLFSLRTGLYSNGSTHQSVLGIETYLTIIQIIL